MTNETEKEAIIDELCNSVNMNQVDFRFCFDYCTINQYDFIFINSLKAKFYHQFKKPKDCLMALKNFKEQS